MPEVVNTRDPWTADTLAAWWRDRGIKVAGRDPTPFGGVAAGTPGTGTPDFLHLDPTAGKAWPGAWADGMAWPDVEAEVSRELGGQPPRTPTGKVLDLVPGRRTEPGPLSRPLVAYGLLAVVLIALSQ